MDHYLKHADEFFENEDSFYEQNNYMHDPVYSKIFKYEVSPKINNVKNEQNFNYDSLSKYGEIYDKNRDIDCHSEVYVHSGFMESGDCLAEKVVMEFTPTLRGGTCPEVNKLSNCDNRQDTTTTLGANPFNQRDHPGLMGKADDILFTDPKPVNTHSYLSNVTHNQSYPEEPSTCWSEQDQPQFQLDLQADNKCNSQTESDIDEIFVNTLERYGNLTEDSQSPNSSVYGERQPEQPIFQSSLTLHTNARGRYTSESPTYLRLNGNWGEFMNRDFCDENLAKYKSEVSKIGETVTVAQGKTLKQTESGDQPADDNPTMKIEPEENSVHTDTVTDDLWSPPEEHEKLVFKKSRSFSAHGSVCSDRSSRLDPHTYSSYTAGILQSSGRSEKFLKLQKHFAVLERISEIVSLKNSPEYGNLYKHDELAKDELNELYEELEEANQKRYFHYSVSGKNYSRNRWNPNADRGLSIKEKSLGDLKAVYDDNREEHVISIIPEDLQRCRHKSSPTLNQEVVKNSNSCTSRNNTLCYDNSIVVDDSCPTTVTEQLSHGGDMQSTYHSMRDAIAGSGDNAMLNIVAFQNGSCLLHRKALHGTSIPDVSNSYEIYVENTKSAYKQPMDEPDGLHVRSISAPYTESVQSPCDIPPKRSDSFKGSNFGTEKGYQNGKEESLHSADKLDGTVKCRNSSWNQQQKGHLHSQFKLNGNSSGEEMNKHNSQFGSFSSKMGDIHQSDIKLRNPHYLQRDLASTVTEDEERTSSGHITEKNSNKENINSHRKSLPRDRFLNTNGIFDNSSENGEKIEKRKSFPLHTHSKKTPGIVIDSSLIKKTKWKFGVDDAPMTGVKDCIATFECSGKLESKPDLGTPTSSKKDFPSEQSTNRLTNNNHKMTADRNELESSTLFSMRKDMFDSKGKDVFKASKDDKSLSSNYASYNDAPKPISTDEANIKYGKLRRWDGRAEDIHGGNYGKLQRWKTADVIKESNGSSSSSANSTDTFIVKSDGSQKMSSDSSEDSPQNTAPAFQRFKSEPDLSLEQKNGPQRPRSAKSQTDLNKSLQNEQYTERAISRTVSGNISDIKRQYLDDLNFRKPQGRNTSTERPHIPQSRGPDVPTHPHIPQSGITRDEKHWGSFTTPRKLLGEETGAIKNSSSYGPQHCLTQAQLEEMTLNYFSDVGDEWEHTRRRNRHKSEQLNRTSQSLPRDHTYTPNHPQYYYHDVNVLKADKTNRNTKQANRKAAKHPPILSRGNLKKEILRNEYRTLNRSGVRSNGHNTVQSFYGIGNSMPSSASFPPGTSTGRMGTIPSFTARGTMGRSTQGYSFVSISFIF